MGRIAMAAVPEDFSQMLQMRAEIFALAIAQRVGLVEEERRHGVVRVAERCG